MAESFVEEVLKHKHDHDLCLQYNATQYNTIQYNTIHLKKER